jgi:hypothetical protein
MSAQEKVIAALRKEKSGELAEFTERYISEGLISLQQDPTYDDVVYVLDERGGYVLATVWTGDEPRVVGNDLERMHDEDQEAKEQD